MKNFKGSAIILALMFITIASIIAMGLYFMYMNSLSSSSRKVADSRLFYASEAGLNHAMLALRRNVAGSESGTGFETTEKDLGKINDCQVKVKVSWISGTKSWSVRSIASLNGRSCVQSINLLKTKGVNFFTAGMLDDMKAHLEYSTGDMFTGELLFGGMLNFDGIPNFMGKVHSYCTKKSVGYEEDDSTPCDNSNQSELSKLLQKPNFADGTVNPYTLGLWDKTDANTEASAQTRLEDYSTVFQGDYSANSGETIQPSKMAYSWSDLSSATPPAGVSSYKYPGNKSTVEIKFLDNNIVTVDGVEIPLTANMILIPSTKTAKLLGGVVKRDLTVVTEQGNVEITNDIIYDVDVLKDNKDKSFSEINDVFANEARNALVNHDKQFGVIAGAGLSPLSQGSTVNQDKGNIYISPEAVTNTVGTVDLGTVTTAKTDLWLRQSDGRIYRRSEYNCNLAAKNSYSNSVVLSGSFFCPNGEFGIKSSNGFVKDGKFAQLRVATIGSVIMYTKGLYRSGLTSWGNWQSGWAKISYKYEESTGIAALMAPDDRSLHGIRPPGFKQLVVMINGVEHFELDNSSEWTYKFE